MPRVCACGCGQVPPLKPNGLRRRFVPGHATRALVIMESQLEHRYFDRDDPGLPYPASAYIDRIGATPDECRAIAEAVAAVGAWADSIMERPHGEGLRYEFEQDSAEEIIERLGLPWQRQVTLMVAVLRVSKERGFNVQYQHRPAIRRRQPA